MEEQKTPEGGVLISVPIETEMKLMGMDNFSAQEKSTIKTDMVFCTFLVNKYVSTVPIRV